MNKKIITTLTCAILITVQAFAQTLTDGQVIKLYEGKAPGTEKWTHSETIIGDAGNQLVFNVSTPEMTVFLPDPSIATGSAMIVCPGGGMCMLSYDSEGTLVAQELNKRGIAAFVLKYRINPIFKEDGKPVSNFMEAMTTLFATMEKAKKECSKDGKECLTSEWCLNMKYTPYALADGLQALKLVRRNAAAWGLKKIGIMGFSAGAINTLNAALNHTDESRPDFTGVIYGGWPSGAKAPKTAAPMFICAPVNDGFEPEETFNIYRSWREAKVPVELHYYSKCEHGFGAVPTNASVDGWIDAMYRFMQDVDFVPKVTATGKSDVKRETYVYAIKGDDTLHIDLYIDHAIQTKDLKPVMIHVHGGGYSAGSRKNVAQEMFSRHFAEMGFVSASIDYRLGVREDNKYKVKDTKEVMRLATEDLVSATNFLLGKAKEWQIDPAMIMTSGGSAGATTILALEHDICNNVDYTKKLPKDFNYAGIISHAGAIIMEGDTLKWEKKPCPMLLFHGDKDFLVPFDKGEAAGFTFVGTKYLHRQLTQMKVPNWAYVEKGADHVMAMKPLMSNNEETDKFVREFIKGKRKAYILTEWADKEPADMSSVDQMLKYVPLYILGFGKYLEEMSGALEKPENIVF